MSMQHVISAIRKRQTGARKVPSLKQLAVFACIDNIPNVGDVPAGLLGPVLNACATTDLLRIEKANPTRNLGTDNIWERHCKRLGIIKKPEKMCWRDVFVQKQHEEQKKEQLLKEKLQRTKERLQAERDQHLSKSVKAIKFLPKEPSRRVVVKRKASVDPNDLISKVIADTKKYKSPFMTAPPLKKR